MRGVFNFASGPSMLPVEGVKKLIDFMKEFEKAHI